MTLHLPHDLESKLREHAAAAGKGPESLALEVLQEIFGAAGDSAPDEMASEKWVAD